MVFPEKVIIFRAENWVLILMNRHNGIESSVFKVYRFS